MNAFIFFFFLVFRGFEIVCKYDYLYNYVKVKIVHLNYLLWLGPSASCCFLLTILVYLNKHYAFIINIIILFIETRSTGPHKLS